MTNSLPILEDLKLVRVPAWWENPWIWLPSLVLLGLAMGLLIRWWRSRPQPVLPPPLTPPGPPPHLQALERLTRLRAQHSSLSAYAATLECSDILRTYIEQRFDVPARYLTTREFLENAQRVTGNQPSRKEGLDRFLHFFDRIKFAQGQASPQETLESIDGVERFIRECIPADAPTGGSK